MVTFEPGRGVAHLLPVEPQTGSWAMCRHHAETLVLPRGWVLVDNRPEAPSLFAVPDSPAATRAVARPRAERARVEDTQLDLEGSGTIATTEPEVRAVWTGHFDADNLDGLLVAETPLLNRAFQAAKAQAV